MEELKVLIIGFGAAGRRFYKVLSYHEQFEPRIAIAGVYDIDPNATAHELPASIPSFGTLADALAIKPDIVVVTVNEDAHFAILQALSDSPPKLVLCEKPLTPTLSEAEQLRGLFSTMPLSMNLTERFSPVVARFLEWKEKHPALEPTRVEFFWGKDRIADTRPTIGVSSEAIHPLDLVDCLIGFDDWKIRSAMGTTSDFSPHNPQLLDAYDIHIDTGRYPIIGHTSFVWPRRDRNIMAILSDEDGGLYRVNFDFDIPLWDCDTLTITAIDYNTNIRDVILDVRTKTSDFPSELAGIYKLYEYIRLSIESILSDQDAPILVDYAQSLKMQKLLHEIDLHLRDDGTITSAGLAASGNANSLDDTVSQRQPKLGKH